MCGAGKKETYDCDVIHHVLEHKDYVTVFYFILSRTDLQYKNEARVFC
jgi:hypothetical protein